MSKPAVTKGTYVDLRFLPGLKVARVSIDIPIEHSNEFLAMFGAPDRASPVWCAVARLQPAEPLAEGAQAPATPEKPTRHFRDMKPSQQAALKLTDPEFCEWLQKHYNTPQIIGFGEDWHDDVLKVCALHIKSKRELDTNPNKAKAWDALLTDYDNRSHIR